MAVMNLVMLILLAAIFERVHRMTNETYIKPLPRTQSSNNRRNQDTKSRSQRADR
jgi:hypothetical protein